MDSATLVEEFINDGQRLLDELRRHEFNVRAACWVKPVDEDRRTLYVATSLVDEQGLKDAYRRFLEVFRSVQGIQFTTSEVNLIGAKDPITRDLLEFISNSYGGSSSFYRRDSLGNLFVDEVFVYSPNPFTVTIYGMIFVGDPSRLAHLSLEPHDPTTRFIVGSGSDSREYPARTGVDWTVAAPEGSALERNEFGLMSLAWNFRGQRTRSLANEVWSFAKLQLNGFRFIDEPK